MLCQNIAQKGKSVNKTKSRPFAFWIWNNALTLPYVETKHIMRTHYCASSGYAGKVAEGTSLLAVIFTGTL